MNAATTEITSVASSPMCTSKYQHHSQQQYRHHDRHRPIAKYSQKADYSDQFALRRYAAPVASWIAYGPKGRAPKVKELKLLKKFMDKMDGKPLPSRLANVLADMKAVLQCLPTRPADGSWNEAEKELRKSFRKLRRRCIESVAETVMVGADCGSAEAELKAEQDDVIQTGEADDPTSPGTSARSDQHLTLFRKMNEWGFLDDAQKLERLQQAEQAAGDQGGGSLSQDRLADAVTMAAACLAAPRRQARLQDACSENLGEARAVLESPQGDNTDLQRRVRSLLLHTLSMWRTYQCDCEAIEHVLDCVQQKINKFENKVGEIQGAAAGKAWLKIKQIVDELLLQVRAPPNLHAQGATKAEAESAHKFRTRQERQSGIQNICWQGQKMGWQCQIGSRQGRQGTGRKARLFPISRFLEQGLGEEAAVEAALQEAKAYREELVRQGKLKPPTPKKAGVVFDKSYQKWRVHLYHPVDKKKLSGGYFASREEAEVKAREMARQYGVPSDFAVTPAKRSTAEVH
ncbi:unnamed protein product [Symbiodinium sp. CCMP2456]|nr:unnamed protein product [Symbiodinium sp. CCMP2456]